MEIVEITEYSDDFLEAINALLPQLSPTSKPLREEDLKKIIKSNCAKLFFAVENKQSLGTLTLVMFKIPTGTRAWIEDIVVDRKSRGRGIGKRLIKHVIQLAKQSGAITVDLTSHPSRKTANALYKKAGFKTRATNVYRYKISQLKEL